MNRIHSPVSRHLFLGFIKLHILYHASHEAVHGLWLIEELDRHGYNLSPGTLYPILHGLEGEGYLKVEKRVVGGKMRKCYLATRQGKVALDEARTRAQELLREIS